MWGETLLLQSGINALIKSATRRARPYVYDPGTPLNRKMASYARVSFYSGHTGTAAAMSFLSARLLCAYVSDHRARTVIWGGAVAYPVVVGVLRVKSGHHFPSDVIVGYVTGATIGYLIPELHRAERSVHFSMQLSPHWGHPLVQLTYRF